MPRRPAEAPREASCAFADEVARACLAALGAEALAEVAGPGRQGVVAGFVLTRGGGAGGGSPRKRPREEVASSRGPPPFAVAVGTGTKFLPNALLSGPGARTGRLVRDCHAEVVARRALKRFLLREVRRAAPGGGGSEVLEESPQAEGRFRLRPGLSLHFYSSSQPCGNACLKRWAKGGRGGARTDLPPGEWPRGAHDRLHVTARDEGQVALLVKRDGSAGGARAAPATADRDCDRDGSAQVSCGHGGVVPPGAVALTEAPECGQTMTCSDKIARWNALGVQGALLAQLLEAPLQLSTITVGRKFSQRHCMRALCCRLQDFRPENPRLRGSLPPGYGICHPSMLCAATRLDEGSMEAPAEGGGGAWAAFGDGPSLVWARGDCRPDRVDGLTGVSEAQADGVSTVAKVTLFALFRDAAEAASRGRWSLPVGLTYRAAKDRARAYAAAREALLGDERLFGGWVSADPLLEAFRCPLRSPAGAEGPREPFH